MSAPPNETKPPVRARVLRVLADQLDLRAVDLKDEQAIVDDLNADSLALVEIILATEEEFELDIPDEDTHKLRTVGDVVRYVEERVK